MEIKPIGRIRGAALPAAVPTVPAVQSNSSEGTVAATRTRSATQSLEEKLLSYLSSGASNEDAAGACGVSVSRVSQICADPEFAMRLQEARFQHASKYVQLDNSWDSAEEKLLEKFHETIPTLHKFRDIKDALAMVNSAKRKSAAAAGPTEGAKTVVNLILPVAAMSRFVTNSQNQVVQTGEQSLITIQSGSLAKMAAASAQGEIDERLLIEKASTGSNQS